MADWHRNRSTYRLNEDYKAVKNTKPPAGQALTDDEQARLFEVAKSNPAWFFAYVAVALDFFCGLRGCEIKGLQWKRISREDRRLSVRRSKTPAGGETRRSTTPALKSSVNSIGAPSSLASWSVSTSSSRGTDRTSA
jgi:integrase